jgi:hypothetical protein
VPVKSGPSRRARLVEREETVTVFFDPEQRGLYAALGERMPPPLWLPLGENCRDLHEALAPYLLAHLPSVHHFSRSLRVFAGTLQDLGMHSFATLLSTLVERDTWLDRATWGSAFDDDPWPLDTTSLSAAEVRQLCERSRCQSPRRIESLSVRTLWSRSLLRIERHPLDGVVFELRYEPSRHPELMRALDDLLPLRLPDDLPVDLAASLLLPHLLTPARVAELLRQKPLSPHLAFVQCALGPGDPTSATLLRTLMSDPTQRDAVVDLASSYFMDGLLRELLAASQDSELSASLERFLSPRVWS